ncbi:hypothetical protein SAMN05444162_0623 [Paenibacillaceae bacterium GAS479]|nr:hypothetical protein SAMN05444162_0623 [Paenibacillaceae bacterium GAS479]
MLNLPASLASANKTRQSDPNLIHDGPLACAIKMLDLQVLLDPIEEELNGPAAAVHLTDFITCQVKAIRHQKELVSLLILRLDHPEFVFHFLLLRADSYTPIGGNHTFRGNVIRF